MNAGRAIVHTARCFSCQGIEDSLTESRMLLCHLLEVTPAGLYTYPESPLSKKQMASLRCMMERRLGGEPLAYILKKRDFYNLSFYVDNNVLIPRQETELVVERALNFCRMSGIKPIVAADIGTGCGAIAVSLAVNFKNIKIYAVDISGEALKVARTNAIAQGVDHKIDFIRADLTDGIPEPVDLLCANLPYVKSADLYKLPSSIINHEPLLALDGGMDGLDIIRRFIGTACEKIKKPGCMLMEIGYDQSAAVYELVKTSYPDAGLVFHADIGGHQRVAEVRF